MLSEEDRAEYLGPLAALEAEHQPRGPLEAFLVKSSGRRVPALPREDRTPEEQTHDETTRLPGLAFSTKLNRVRRSSKSSLPNETLMASFGRHPRG